MHFLQPRGKYVFVTIKRLLLNNLYLQVKRRVHHIPFNFWNTQEQPWPHLLTSAKRRVRSGLRCCGRAALKHRMQAGLKCCPGLGLLIVSSVLAKSAGCDSRPLSVTRWPLGLAFSPLTCPITASTISLSSPHSHLKVFVARMRINALVSKKRNVG